MRPLFRSPLLGWGAGVVAGGFEAIQIGSKLALDLSFAEALALGLLAVLCNGLLGLVFGLGVGFVVERVGHREPGPGALAWCLAASATGLCAFFMLRAAGNLLDQGRTLAAVCFALSPLGLCGVVWFNAHYWFRREAIGEEYRLGWRGISGLLAGALVLLNAALVAGSSSSRASADPSAPSVLLLTLDTLRRDHISAYGDSPVATPNLDALAERGVLFLDAVTPLPETAPAHAAMFTGRHPVRIGMLSNADVLKRGYTTLAERLEDAGYATGAFVSSYALDSRTGLDQGFTIYDDDFWPVVHGLSEILLVEYALRAWMRFGDPTRLDFLYERAAPQTCDRALRWIAANQKGPFFAWVHTFEPHSPYVPHGLPGFEDNGSPEAPALDHREILAKEPGYAYTEAERARLRRLYAEEVAYTDLELGRFLAAVEALKIERPLVILLMGDHGEMLGEHGVDFNHHGIWEPALRVPLVIVPPDLSKVQLRRVPYQVRSMDLFTAATDLLHLDPTPGTEGFPLMALAEGGWDKGISTLLVGRVGLSLSEGMVLGYRSGGVKYHLDQGTGKESIFDIDADPGEGTDLSSRWAELLVTARERVRDETRGRAVQADAEDLGEDAAERLRALGYRE